MYRERFGIRQEPGFTHFLYTENYSSRTPSNILSQTLGHQEDNMMEGTWVLCSCSICCCCCCCGWCGSLWPETRTKTSGHPKKCKYLLRMREITYVCTFRGPIFWLTVYLIMQRIRILGFPDNNYYWDIIHHQTHHCWVSLATIIVRCFVVLSDDFPLKNDR